MLRVLFVVLLLAVGTEAPAADTQKLLERVRDEQDAPAAALILVSADGPEIIEAAGLRTPGGEEVAPDDLWHIGSNHKSVTSFAALTLAEQGRLSLDDSVAQVLGDRFDGIDPAWSGITLRQLLQHRGGLQPNITRLQSIRGIMFPSGGAEGPQKDRQRVLRGVLKEPPAGEPGNYVYSNLGYTLAGEMIGAAAGSTYEAALEELVWKPLGLTPDAARLGAVKGQDVLRGHQGVPPRPAPDGADNPALMSPAGTFSYSLDGYGAYLVDQLRGHMDDDRALLAAESYASMRTPPEGGDYALGWAVRDDGTLVHSGSNTFWLVTTVLDPESGLGAVVLVNQGSAQGLLEYAEELIEQHRPGGQ
jgi:CubicO group peptidase (beta-lactamase class C family)